jgi:ribosome maturation factor RimP
MSAAEQVRALVDPVLDGLGLTLVDLAVTSAGRRRVVRVLVDRNLTELDPHDHTSPVPPVDLDSVAEASQAISRVLDDSDVMGQTPYVLEVSSPGVGRTMRSVDDFRRHVGRLVTLRGHDGVARTGRLAFVSAHKIKLHPDGGKTIELPCEDVDTGRVEVEFAHLGDDD